MGRVWYEAHTLEEVIHLVLSVAVHFSRNHLLGCIFGLMCYLLIVQFVLGKRHVILDLHFSRSIWFLETHSQTMRPDAKGSVVPWLLVGEKWKVLERKTWLAVLVAVQVGQLNGTILCSELVSDTVSGFFGDTSDVQRASMLSIRTLFVLDVWLSIDVGPLLRPDLLQKLIDGLAFLLVSPGRLDMAGDCLEPVYGRTLHEDLLTIPNIRIIKYRRHLRWSSLSISIRHIYKLLLRLVFISFAFRCFHIVLETVALVTLERFLHLIFMVARCASVNINIFVHCHCLFVAKSSLRIPTSRH